MADGLKTFIFTDKDKFIEQRLKDIKENLNKNLDSLPKEELPFMELHLRALYFQSYFLFAEGFYNASLVLCGILLENLVKEKLFMHGVKDEELENINFGQAIQKCEQMKLLSEELKFLKEKKEKLRNPYAHYNKMKLSEGIYYPVWKVKNPVEKLISLHERVSKGELTEAEARQELIKGVSPTLMSSKEFRPIATMAKSQVEEEGLAKYTFLEIDKFTRDFAIKYFKPKDETTN